MPVFASAAEAEDPKRPPAAISGFEENQGQLPPEARFVGRVGASKVRFTNQGVEILASKSANTETRSAEALADRVTESFGIGMRFGGRATESQPTGVDVLPGRVNYYVGPREAWRIGVPRYAKILYPAVYSGIDAVFYEQTGRLKYDFLVSPGASPASIQLVFDGISALQVTEGGALRLSTPGGELLHAAPYCYQSGGDHDVLVPARFVIVDSKTAGFELGPFDTTRPLVIDPVIEYGTYLGGNGTDSIHVGGMDADSAGNLYVTGFTDSATGTLWGRTSIDGFVAKIDPKLAPAEQIRYVTYFGGQLEEEMYDVFVDAQGRVYAAGLTRSGEFYPQAGCPSAVDRAFYVRLDETGSLQGGASAGCGLGFFEGIAADTAGNVYAVGRVFGASSPAAIFPPTYPGSASTFARFGANDILTHVGYLGGVGRDVAIGGDGSVYVAADTNYPYRAFVAKIDSSLQTFHYLTVVTTTQAWEFVFAIALNPSGSVLLAGELNEDGEPYHLRLVVSKLDPRGDVSWRTIMGNGSGAGGRSVTVDWTGTVYATAIGDIPHSDAFTPALGGAGGSIVRLRPDLGTVEWSTPMDPLETGIALRPTAVATDGEGNVYVYGKGGTTPLINASSGGFQPGSFPADLFLIGIRDDPPVRLLPATTRWKPQRDATTSIEVVFRAPEGLQAGTTLEVTDPTGVLLQDPDVVFEQNGSDPTLYKLIWSGPWLVNDPGGTPTYRKYGDYNVVVKAVGAEGGVFRSASADPYARVSLVEVRAVELCQNDTSGGCATLTTPYPGVSADNPALEKVPGQDPPQWRLGGGKRIFAEASAPGGTPSNRIKVRAKIEPVIHPDPSRPPEALAVAVRFASFDVDDPAPYAPDMDGDGGGVNDNRGQPLQGSIPSEAVVVQPGQEIASALLVTSLQPGDNYRVVASTSQQWLSTVEADPSSLTGEMDLPSEQQVSVSPMLTVWRTLNVELESMAPPPPLTTPPDTKPYKERNFIKGEVTRFERPPGPSPGWFILQPEATTPPLGIDDGSQNLDSTPPGRGRFEGGKLVIGDNAITIQQLHGSGSTSVTEHTSNTPAPMRCRLALPGGGGEVDRDVLVWDAPTRQFNLAQAVSPTYEDGTLTLAGAAWTIESVTGTQVTVQESTKPQFLVVDDDASFASLEPNRSLLSESDNPLVNAFAQAYVRPLYWSGGTKTPPFQRNIRCDSPSEAPDSVLCSYSEIAAQLALGRDIPQTTTGFWASYVQGAFQDDQKRDGDGLDELEVSVIIGSTPESLDAHGSAVYLEPIDEIAMRLPAERDQGSSRTLVHELGHQFGLGDNTGAIMMQGGLERYFSAAHLDQIRRKGATP